MIVRVNVLRSELPVVTIDGAAFDDFEGFAREFSRCLALWQWNGSLDAFNDILRGGFGTPDEPWVLRWLNSETSARALGHPAMAKRLEELLPRVHHLRSGVTDMVTPDLFIRTSSAPAARSLREERCGRCRGRC